MLRQVASLAGDAAHEMMQPMLRQAARQAVLICVALMLAGSAILFGEVALYFHLRRFATPQAAALIVAGSALVLLAILMLGVWIGGAAGGSRARPAARPQMAAAAGASAAAAANPGSDATRLAADAEAIGALLGRDLKGYPLVLTAFAVGMLLGRSKR